MMKLCSFTNCFVSRYFMTLKFVFMRGTLRVVASTCTSNITSENTGLPYKTDKSDSKLDMYRGRVNNTLSITYCTCLFAYVRAAAIYFCKHGCLTVKAVSYYVLHVTVRGNISHVNYIAIEESYNCVNGLISSRQHDFSQVGIFSEFGFKKF
jgi:hypothetical protein